MGKRLSISCIMLALTFLSALADQPFRNQRYDALKVLEVNEQSIVFVGNSITNMHDWFEAFCCDDRVAGRGVSGAVSSELLDNIEAILVGHPAKMFILIGTNDLGTYSDNDGNPDVEIPFANMKRILSRVTNESPETEVYVQAVLPTGNSEGYIKRVTYTKRLNSKVKEHIEELGNAKVHYLDTFTPLLKGTVLDSKYTADGLHLFASGYQVWCHFIKEQVGLEPVYPDPATSPVSNISQEGFGGSHLMRASYFNSYKVNSDNILLIGDDMIHGAEWHELLHSTKVLNRGSGWGYNSFNIATMTKALPAILHGKPAPAQIWLCPAHNDANASKAATVFKSDVKTFITTARNKLASNAGTKFVLMACPPSNNASVNTNFIVKYNEAMKAIANEEEGVEFLDIYTPLVNGDVADTRYSTDGRVYGKGYVRIAQTMLPLVREVDPQAKVISDSECNALYNKIAARKTLGDLCQSTVELLEGDKADRFSPAEVAKTRDLIAETWALLQADPTTIEANNKVNALNKQVSQLRKSQSSNFRTTTITDGKFAEGTVWYTLQLSAAGWYLSDNAGAQYIELKNNKTQLKDADLWCFVGNNTDGYTLYNKAAGTGMVLASPATMSGTTGATAYPILKDATKLGTYRHLWIFEGTDVLGDDTPAFYMYQKENSANKVNNRDSKMAFWTGGQDAGSAVQVTEGLITVPFNKNTGEFTVGKGVTSFNSRWTANKTDFPAEIFCAANNMTYSGDNLIIYSGTAQTSTYNIVAPEGYKVLGYTFTFTGEVDGIRLTTSDGQSFTSKTTSQVLNVWGLDEDAAFTIAGANKGITLDGFNVFITKDLNGGDAEEQVEVFVTTSSPNYRIPAIATTRKGTVVAVADYRYGGSDIGYGSVELRRRLSYDNGQTWGDILEFTNGNYATSPKPKYDAAYGDPCIVADRTSDKIMVISCSGNTGFPDGTRSVHQGIMRFYSTDEGETWSKPVNLESQFYSLLDQSDKGPIRSMFIGSGRIFQSSITKVGDYYRLYCSGLVKDKNGTNCNYVYYSDDFGESWHVLGDINTPAISNGDEPKAEEMPDGSVICSSRIGGGRRFNIFTFTDMEKAEGSWGTEAASTSANKGVIGPSCNGEIMIVPVTRNADGKAMYLALHSTPASTSRTNVSIYYKGLPDFDSFQDAATFAANWEGKHQATKLGSAYSTFTLMQNNHIGFLYEESTYGKDYTIVFKDYSIEQITDSAYSYNPDMRRTDFLSEHIEGKIDKVFQQTGKYVGMIDIDKRADVDALVARFRQSGDFSDYLAIIAGLQDAQVKVTDTKEYFLCNRQYPTMFLTWSINHFIGAVQTSSTATKQVFRFVDAGDGLWYLYNTFKKVYLNDTPGAGSEMQFSADQASAGKFAVISQLDGRSALVSQNPKAAASPAISLNASKKVVAGGASAEASKWLIESLETTGMADLRHNSGTHDGALYNLNGQQVGQEFRGIVIQEGRKRLLK